MIPGRWTLKPIEGGPPRYYYFDRKALDVDLAPGGAVEIVLDVLPLERRVPILERVEIPVQQER